MYVEWKKHQDRGSEKLHLAVEPIEYRLAAAALFHGGLCRERSIEMKAEPYDNRLLEEARSAMRLSQVIEDAADTIDIIKAENAVVNELDDKTRKIKEQLGIAEDSILNDVEMYYTYVRPGVLDILERNIRPSSYERDASARIAEIIDYAEATQDNEALWLNPTPSEIAIRGLTYLRSSNPIVNAGRRWMNSSYPSLASSLNISPDIGTPDWRLRRQARAAHSQILRQVALGPLTKKDAN